MKLLIILFVSLIILPIDAGNIPKQLQIDSSKIEVRYPSKAAVAKFKSDKDFLYNEGKANNWWDAFWLWVNDKLSKLFGTEVFVFFQRYLGYLIILAAVIIVILVLNKSKLSGLFYSRKEEKVSGFKEMKEDINKFDFDNLISEAISKKDFRIAVRLHYLKSLKLLADKKLINWNPNKTNHNYIREIKDTELKKPFEELTSLFEWIWYGELPVEESLFKETRNMFDNFQTTLAVEK